MNLLEAISVLACRKRLLRVDFPQVILGLLWASCLVLGGAIAPTAALAADLPSAAAALFERAKQGRRYAEAEALRPQILPTADGQSFVVVWKPRNETPSRWIVSLHGSRGFATDDLATWHPHLANRNLGLICLQWWKGGGDTAGNYLTPRQIYAELDGTLRKLGVVPGAVVLHGFSRGSANSYALAAIDAGLGRRYFDFIVASSGGLGLDYPPTRDIALGKFGDRPLHGTRWVTVAGARDQHPERDGIAGMRRAGKWLGEQGAEIVAALEDPDYGHGALVLNPRNAARVLDLVSRGR